MGLGERQEARLAQLGTRQSDLARWGGVSQLTTAGLTVGRSRSSAHLHTIARELRTTAPYLRRNRRPERERFYLIHCGRDRLRDGIVEVSEIDPDVGTGVGLMVEAQVTEAERWILRDWVSNCTTNPVAVLAIAGPTGESMYPATNDRALVLIDRSQAKIDRGNRIWLLVFGGVGMIERVWMLPDGIARLIADNPQMRGEVVLNGKLLVMGRGAGVFPRN